MRRFEFKFDDRESRKGRQVVEAVSYQAACDHFDSSWPDRVRYCDVELADNDPGYTGFLRYNEATDSWEKDQ